MARATTADSTAATVLCDRRIYGRGTPSQSALRLPARHGPSQPAALAVRGKSKSLRLDADATAGERRRAPRVPPVSMSDYRAKRSNFTAPACGFRMSTYQLVTVPLPVSSAWNTT